MDISPATAERLRKLVVAVQKERRLPSLVVAVAASGSRVEHLSVGQGDLAAPRHAAPDMQYRIGSITKTVTAAAVMQLVAEGKLDLRGPLSQGWPGAPHDDISLADLLTHGSGLQREPPGSVWESLSFPACEESASTADNVKRLYPQDSWFHYSNLGFALLGELVAQVSGTTWESYVLRRILLPLGMHHTTLLPEPSAAQGYSVMPYSDEAVAEPAVDCRGLAPAAQLWSTADDLCRWTGLLGGCRPDVLATSTLTQMTGPRTIADLDHWSLGFGLGLMLVRDGESIYVGHTGSMPGFLAAVLCHPASRLGVAVLTNATAGVKVGQLAVQLLTLVRDDASVTGWGPSEPPPDSVRPLLGRWWSEWREWVFRWQDGTLQAGPAEAVGGDELTRFSQVGPDEFVALTGTERGERLVVVRGDGQASAEVYKLYWATYPFTRQPTPFGEAP